jgi:hypothetical protein
VAAIALAGVLALVVPATAAAHAGGVEYKFPLPVWMYAFAGGLAAFGTAPAAAAAIRSPRDWLPRPPRRDAPLPGVTRGLTGGGAARGLDPRSSVERVDGRGARTTRTRLVPEAVEHGRNVSGPRRRRTPAPWRCPGSALRPRRASSIERGRQIALGTLR